MLYTHASELAIRAALFLALQPPGKLSPVHEIAQGTGLRGPYLAKIMRRLIRARLVRAFRGPGGGVQLGRAPETITLWSVVRAMEGPAQPEWCVMGLRNCSPSNPCPLHEQWSSLRNEIQSLLEGTTLASIVQGLRDSPELVPEFWGPVASELLQGRQRGTGRKAAAAVGSRQNESKETVS